MVGCCQICAFFDPDQTRCLLLGPDIWIQQPRQTSCDRFLAGSIFDLGVKPLLSRDQARVARL